MANVFELTKGEQQELSAMICITEAKARGLAASCNRDDENGWTYTAKPAGGPAPPTVENPTHQRWWTVEVCDETGHLLGNL